jgi:hypothetical protein
MIKTYSQRQDEMCRSRLRHDANDAEEPNWICLLIFIDDFNADQTAVLSRSLAVETFVHYANYGRGIIPRFHIVSDRRRARR